MLVIIGEGIYVLVYIYSYIWVMHDDLYIFWYWYMPILFTVSHVRARARASATNTNSFLWTRIFDYLSFTTQWYRLFIWNVYLYTIWHTRIKWVIRIHNEMEKHRHRHTAHNVSISLLVRTCVRAYATTVAPPQITLFVHSFCAAIFFLFIHSFIHSFVCFPDDIMLSIEKQISNDITFIHPSIASTMVFPLAPLCIAFVLTQVITLIIINKFIN